MLNVLKWFLIGVSFLILSACEGGGGGTPDKNTTVKHTEPAGKIIKGYVVDEPIQNATIELQEINGTLIKRFENVTQQDGSFNLTIDDTYENKNFILRAYNGTINNKPFDGDLYGYHLAGDDLEINLTPLNTLLLTLSSEFSDVDFSARIAKAKSLLESTYKISDDEFDAIKDSDFNNFDIAKFRLKVESVGFNSLVNSLVGDCVDGYADDENTKAIFLSAKQRVLKDAKSVFAVTDSNLSSSDISKLNIRGISEKADGTTGTMGMLTDVVATKTITIKDSNGTETKKDTIVFRSFNVGKWKGKLNEETTLLARIFIDYRLANLTSSVQEDIAKRLIKERKDDFEEAIKYQTLATDVPFAMPYYIELMEGLRTFALSYISNHQIAQKDRVGATLSKLSKSMKRFGKAYTTDKDNLVSMGLLQVRANDEALEFANYAKVNYGFRAYEIDGAKQAYDYPMTDFKANIIKSTVSGGTVGGIWDYAMNNTFKFDSNGNKIAYKSLLGEDNSFDNVSKVKLEMYKWQFGYPTLLNVADGIELAVKVGKSSGISWGEKVKKRFENISNLYDGIKLSAIKVDSLITIGSSIINIYKDFTSISGITDYTKSKEFTELKTKMKKITDVNGKVIKTINYIDGLLGEKGYDTESIRDWNEIKDIAGVSFSTSGLNLVIPKDKNNNFNEIMAKVLTGKIHSLDNKLSDQAKHTKLKYILLVGAFNKMLFNPIMKKIKTDKLFDKSMKTKIDDFNKKYEKAFTFTQMHYFMSLELNSKNEKDKLLFTTLYKSAIKKLDEVKVKEARKEYAQILIKYISNKNGISLGRVIKSNFKVIENTANSLDNIAKLTKGIKSISKQDFKKVFTSIGNFLIDTALVSAKNLAGDVAKSAAKALLGGGLKAGLAANDISSYVAGNFLTPNKQYLELDKDGDKITIKRPPLTMVGIDSTGIIKHTGWDNIFNKDGKDNSYLIAVDNKDKVLYKPSFDVYLSQVRESSFKNMLKNAKFPGDEFMIFDLTTEKSDNNNADGNFQTYKTLATPQSLKVDDIQDAWLRKGENDLYSFNIIDAWIHKLGGISGGNYDKVLIGGNERGVYRDFLRAKFIQPLATEKEFILPSDLTTQIVSKKNYIYKASTGDALGKKLTVEIINNSGNDYLRVTNTNSFNIYLEVSFDKKKGIVYDNKEIVGDYKINKNSVYLLPLFNFKDDTEHYNDVEFRFYDEIAQTFFKNIGFSEPRLSNYLQANNGWKLDKELKKLTYSIKLDDITKTGKYLMITSYGNGTDTESTLSDNGEIKIEFNMPLSNESLNKIKVYDYEEKRYLNSDEYSVTHTSGNEYLITIKNYKNHHEYKLVFPSDLTSVSGDKFLEEREISNFVYYNQAPIAKAKVDKNSIKEGETITLDASESSDKDGTIDKYEWKDSNGKSLGNGVTLSINSLKMGENIITLTVTDNEGTINSDKVKIEVGNPLTTPTNLKQEKISNTKTKVSWDSVPNAEGYDVYVSSNMLADSDDIFEYERVYSATDRKDFKVVSPSHSIVLDVESGKEYGVIVKAYKGNIKGVHFSDLLVFSTTSSNTPPTANAGADQIIKEGESVTLDASGSSDVEDEADALTYIWKWKSNDDNSTLEKEAKSFEVAGLSVGEHIFTLTVTDTNGASSSDDVKITVESNATINLGKGLVAHYKFDEQDGATTLIDSSGNHNDGTIHGGVIFVDGVIGKAGSFDGVDDYIEIQHSKNLDITKSIAISTWVNLDNIDTIEYGKDWVSIFTKDNFTTSYGLMMSLGDNKMWSFYHNGLNKDNTSFNSKNIIRTNQWFHIVVTYDYDKNISKIYINNQLKFSESVNGSIEHNLKSILIAKSGGEWYPYFLDGKLDDLRIYNRALNEAEIKELYKLGQVKETVNLSKGLVAHYKFDEQDGATTLIDSSGNHNDGTIHGGVTFVDGVIGKAGRFDGVDDYVEIKNHNFNITDSISVSLWRKSKNNAMLLQWGEACPDGDSDYKGTTLTMGLSRYYELTYHPLNENRDKFAVNINSGTGNYYDPRIFSVSTEPMVEDEYEHLLFVFKDKVLTLYKNGKIISQYHGADKGGSGNTEKITLDEFKKIFISSATIKIGVNESYCNYSHEFNSFLNGDLDDLRIYNRALSEAEIKELYGLKNEQNNTQEQYIRDDNVGIVKDNNTNLMWQDNTSVKYQWADAINYCNNLTLANYKDWHLPTKEELSTINNGDAESYFDYFIPYFHWTISVPSDPDASNYGTKAWYIHLGNRGSYYSSKKNNFNVKCVRGNTQ